MWVYDPYSARQCNSWHCNEQIFKSSFPFCCNMTQHHCVIRSQHFNGMYIQKNRCPITLLPKFKNSQLFLLQNNKQGIVTLVARSDSCNFHLWLWGTLQDKVYSKNTCSKDNVAGSIKTALSWTLLTEPWHTMCNSVPPVCKWNKTIFHQFV
jgi:hypothetical protein